MMYVCDVPATQQYHFDHVLSLERTFILSTAI